MPASPEVPLQGPLRKRTTWKMLNTAGRETNDWRDVWLDKCNVKSHAVSSMCALAVISTNARKQNARQNENKCAIKFEIILNVLVTLSVAKN